MSNIIKTQNLIFEYANSQNSNRVLKDINLTIKKGEFVAILGHNGSGKSTLAKHFNAILLPSQGCVWVDDIKTDNEQMLFDIRSKVGLVFQNPDNQIVASIVEEDVAFAPENLGVEPSQIRAQVNSALASVGMTKYTKHAVHHLSGGQKQRVAIAGILAMNPECIVLDEPTAMLDPKGRAEIMKTIKALNENGTTIILITHFMEEAVKANRVVVIDSGKIVLDGKPEQVFSQVELLKQVGLDVPPQTELCVHLKSQGYDMQDYVLTEDECVKALSKLFDKSGVKRNKNCL